MGRAGRARFLGTWPPGGEIPRDLAPGRAKSRMGVIPRTPVFH